MYTHSKRRCDALHSWTVYCLSRLENDAQGMCRVPERKRRVYP